MTSRRRARPPKGRPAKERPSTGRPTVDRLAVLLLWGLILVPPLVFDPASKDSFRLPKELLTELLVLASLTLLAFRLRGVGRMDWRRLLRHRAVLAAGPLLAVATLGWFLTEHVRHVRVGWSSFAVGAAALVGWSLALCPEERRRLLYGTVVPATLLALLAVAQTHRLFDPFEFEDLASARRGLTSLAGGAFDLAAYLVLPVLVAQIGLFRATSAPRRWGWGAALAVCLYAMTRTQTLTALAALAAASLVLWAVLLPPRRMLAAAALLTVVGGALAMAVGPLRERVVKQTRRLAQGEFSMLLSGRPDAWQAALWMLERRPVVGVGLGAYTTEFARAKLELSEDGVKFAKRLKEPHFASAHNEYLEVAAECGWLGILALAWGLGVLARELLRRTREAPRAPDGGEGRADLALMWSGAAALVVLALAFFPMHLAIIAYPFILLLGWILAERDRPREATS